MMETGKHNERTDTKLTDGTRSRYLGTRICTQADVLRKNMWIAWNALEKAFMGSQRSSRVEKSRVEKVEVKK